MKNWLFYIMVLWLTSCQDNKNDIPADILQSPFGISWDMNEDEMRKISETERYDIFDNVKAPKPDFNEPAISATYKAYFNNKKLMFISAEYEVKTLAKAEEIFQFYRTKLPTYFENVNDDHSNNPNMQGQVCKENGICVLDIIGYERGLTDRRATLTLYDFKYHKNELYGVSISYKKIK